MKMSHFKELYGKKCDTPISWDDPMSRVVLAPDMLKEMK